MCKTRNVLIEIIESPAKRTFVVREFTLASQPPTTLAVCDTADEVAQFLDDFKII